MSNWGNVKLLICAILLSYAAACRGYSHCNCEDEGGFWTATRILECQRVSDFFIAIAYFSIPVELLYFVSCSNLPFKWVFIQFIAFIVLCGLTHLLTAWSYSGQPSFQLMVSLTIFKLLTALVSCATTITLLTLIPLLLKVKVREVFLRQNVLELGLEVGMMKRKKEATLHVRMLTKEIRKSLDKHTVLYSTLVELSKTLGLHNCAVWMDNNEKEMSLTHELKPRKYPCCVSMTDPDVMEIKKSNGVKTLRPDSVLGVASKGEIEDTGPMAAIRMPMLRDAILVLVFPSSNKKASIWSSHELEIVEAVADQVAVALSHADILQESRNMRNKLAEQNHALLLARKRALMASQARNAFQKVMSNGMRRPMHSILGLLSMFHDRNTNLVQRVVVETMVRSSHVLSTLVNDVMEIPVEEDGRFPLQMKVLSLVSLLREAACLLNSLFVFRGIGFSVHVQGELPDRVIGDERRTFQVILHMVGYLLDLLNGGCSVVLRVSSDICAAEGENDKYGLRRPTVFGDSVNVKLEFKIDGLLSGSENSNKRRYNNDDNKELLSFSMCQMLVQKMQGNIWITPDPSGQPESMSLQLRFKIQRLPDSPEQTTLSPSFKGLKIMLVEDDNVNRIVTTRLLEKLGCEVSAVSSGFECLTTLGPAGGSSVPFEVILLDLHMPEMDGFEVAMRVRKFHGRSGLPIIALTASAEDNVWERCCEMGMNGLIRKPIVLQGIADELVRVLRR